MQITVALRLHFDIEWVFAFHTEIPDPKGNLAYSTKHAPSQNVLNNDVVKSNHKRPRVTYHPPVNDNDDDDEILLGGSAEDYEDFDPSTAVFTKSTSFTDTGHTVATGGGAASSSATGSGGNRHTNHVSGQIFGKPVTRKPFTIPEVRGGSMSNEVSTAVSVGSGRQSTLGGLRVVSAIAVLLIYWSVR